jgi:hypothetical protein
MKPADNLFGFNKNHVTLIMFKRPVKRYFIFFLIAILASASRCGLIIGPDFPLTPSISFRRFEVERNKPDPKLGNRVDQLDIIIYFKDGDGDLGLTSEDRQNNPRYQQNNPDGTPNEYYYNYFATLERKVNGTFVEDNSGVPYSGAFPPLKPDGKPGPIEGELAYTVLFPLLIAPPNDTIRFKVQILDRELRRSNEIYTDPVVVNPR